MNAETIFDVIQRLTGPINPLGESSIDEQRYENIKTFIDVYQFMNDRIENIAVTYGNSPYASEKKIGDVAVGCINNKAYRKI